MSDLDDDERGRRRKKKIEHESESDSMTGKTPIILAKPQVDRSVARASSTETPRLAVTKPSTAAVTSDEVVPTRILKSADNGRSLSNSGTSRSVAAAAPSSLKGCGDPHAGDSDANNPTFIPTAVIMPIPKIQIQQKSSSTAGAASGGGSMVTTPQTEKAGLFENSLDARLAPYPEMKGCVKLIDESLQWCDQVSEFLQDQLDFLVVGVIGLQGTGKSTVMNLLAGKKNRKTSRPEVFKTQTRDQRELGEHCTKGIDLFVTNHRIILLDVQPMLSPSVMDHVIQFEKKFPIEYSSTENALEIQSLQLAAFLMTACHVIVLVQDWFADSDVLRFLQTAELLRPPALLAGHDGGGFAEDSTEYFPHLVFLHNKCTLSDFEPSKVRVMQETYAKVFKKSKLKFRTPVGIGLGDLIPCLRPDVTGEPVNLFLLPSHKFHESDCADDDCTFYRGTPNFHQLIESFRKQVYSMPHQQMLHAALSEKTWLHYAGRTWETVKKSGLFMDYCRLLP